MNLRSSCYLGLEAAHAAQKQIKKNAQRIKFVLLLLWKHVIYCRSEQERAERVCVCVCRTLSTPIRLLFFFGVFVSIDFFKCSR